MLIKVFYNYIFFLNLTFIIFFFRWRTKSHGKTNNFKLIGQHHKKRKSILFATKPQINHPPLLNLEFYLSAKFWSPNRLCGYPTCMFCRKDCWISKTFESKIFPKFQIFEKRLRWVDISKQQNIAINHFTFLFTYDHY